MDPITLILGALAAAGKTIGEQAITRTIRLLVPIAAGDPTPLGSVVARLLLDSRPNELNMLRALSEVAARAAAAAPPDAELVGQLTRFVP